MVTNRELQYRNLDTLINVCSVDLRTYYSDGIIETAELIKVAQKINYELGLQINQTKETIIEIEHGRSKLPSDFNFLNFAMICRHYTTHEKVTGGGIVQTEDVTWNPPANYLTSCPCWTIVSYGAQCTVTSCSGAKSTMFFPANSDGSPITSQICATYVDVTTAMPAGNLTASTNSYCYNNATTGQLQCNQPPPDCDCQVPPESPCQLQSPDYDPWKQNKVRTMCNGTVDIKIVEECHHEERHYHHFEPIFIQSCRRASAFCSQDDFRLPGNVGILKDNFLELGRIRHDRGRGFAIDHEQCVKVYLNYQGMLEDEDGNLLVLDHPMINEYYEFAIKERILQNLYLNGEPDIERRLHYMEGKLREARHDALQIAYMPDFSLIKSTMSIQRRKMNEIHVAPFSRYYGMQHISAFYDSMVNGRYRE